MSKGEKNKVRLVRSNPTPLKVFQPIAGIPERIKIPPDFAPTHLVVKDLRRGSLWRLGKYLLQRQAIPDKGIALELALLILGGSEDTKYRLAVIPHPDGPKNRGGQKPSAEKRKRDAEILRVHAEVLLDKKQLALADAEVARRYPPLKASTIAKIRRETKKRQPDEK